MKSQKNKKSIASKDCYEFLIEGIESELFTEKSKKSISPKFMSSWLWIYVMSPLIGCSILIVGYYFYNKLIGNYFWAFILVGEVITAFSSTYGVTIISSKESRVYRVVFAILLFVFLFSPWKLSSIYFDFLSTESNLSISVVFTVFIILILGLSNFIVAMLSKLFVVFSELRTFLGPSILATLGKFSSYTKTKMDRVLMIEIGSCTEHTKEYESIQTQAQSVVNSTNALILPWITLIASVSIISKNIEDFFQIFFTKTALWEITFDQFDKVISIGGLIQTAIITLGFLGILNIAKQTFINTLIIQSIARLSVDKK